MIKKDIPIMEEFLGTREVSEIVTPLKCCRIYAKRNNGDEFIVILTPMLAEDNKMINIITESNAKFGKNLKPIEHKRGKNFVYTFEKG
jgi:hypothetical protein